MWRSEMSFCAVLIHEKLLKKSFVGETVAIAAAAFLYWTERKMSSATDRKASLVIVRQFIAE